MKAVIQRVSQASVSVEENVVGRIGVGMLILLGIGRDDSEETAARLADKLVSLRIFSDADGKMNASIADVQGSFLVVSQFTLYGDCQKGRRPSFDHAADPVTAQKLYEYFIAYLRTYGRPVECGQFRAMMDVALVNDGPVTFILEI